MAENTFTPAELAWQQKYTELRSDPRWTQDAQAFLAEAELLVREGDTLETGHILAALFNRANEDQALTKYMDLLGDFPTMTGKVGRLARVSSLPWVGEPPEGAALHPVISISSLAFAILNETFTSHQDGQVGVYQIASSLLSRSGGSAGVF